MATNTAGQVTTHYHTNQIHYLQVPISYTQGNGTVVPLGYIPSVAVVLRAQVVVTTAFNAGTTNTLDIGITGTATAFANAIALGTAGVIVSSGTATSAGTSTAPGTPTQVTATLHMTGTAATTGAGYVVVEYVVFAGP